jgi:outer membrane biosynthesis protein TonB
MNRLQPLRAGTRQAQFGQWLISQNQTKQATVSISIHSYDNDEVRSAGLGNPQIAAIRKCRWAPVEVRKTEANPVNFGSFGLSQETSQSATGGPWDENSNAGAQLLELRTPAGAVYVCPSRWQRIRLQWAFRHFHVLPLQVLSRRDQRLIETLSQSAVVTPASPVTRATVLGVVENLYPKPPASAARVVTMQPQPALAKPFRPMSWTPAVLSPDFSQRSKEREMKQIFGTAKSREVRDVAFRQWRALGALAAACVTLIVASFYGILPSSRTAPMNNAPALPARAQASNKTKPAVVISPAPIPPPTLATAKPRRQIAPLPADPALPHNELAFLEHATDQPVTVTRAKAPPALPQATARDTIVERIPITSAPGTAPLLVSELPQGHFAHPVVSRPNLVGELQLKALIGADGLVKNVTVLSGDPKLAEAAMRAVRQWHYAPYQVLGNPVEVETRIKMNFFGEDAVSVASVAAAPPPTARIASVPSPNNPPLSTRPND